MRFLLMIRRRRRGGRGRRRRGNHNRLSGLQFAAVLDLIELLQFFDANFVHLGDGSERLSACDGVRVAVSGSGWLGRSGSRGRRWRAFADHHSGADVSDLLLELENLLRKSVDLGVLRIDFSCQRFELGRVR